ncbi:MAG: RNA methyltransferase [Melioribacteraceae bacterium]|nr:RNA methyltransferase [Melioribacteraceae bacterium]
MEVTAERSDRLKRAAANRQIDLTVILENVHDPHNIGAVLRSCDAVGISEVYILNTDPRITAENLIAGKSSSSGARKWVKTHYFEDMNECLKRVRLKYNSIWASNLDSISSEPIHEINLAKSIALAFGNEHDGISKELLESSDGTFHVPMKGLIQSLNISVACAVTLYESLRQRQLAGKYSNNYNPNDKIQNAFYQDFIKIHFKEKYKLK